MRISHADGRYFVPLTDCTAVEQALLSQHGWSRTQTAYVTEVIDRVMPFVTELDQPALASFRSCGGFPATAALYQIDRAARRLQICRAIDFDRAPSELAPRRLELAAITETSLGVFDATTDDGQALQIHVLPGSTANPALFAGSHVIIPADEQPHPNRVLGRWLRHPAIQAHQALAAAADVFAASVNQIAEVGKSFQHPWYPHTYSGVEAVSMEPRRWQALLSQKFLIDRDPGQPFTAAEIVEWLASRDLLAVPRGQPADLSACERHRQCDPAQAAAMAVEKWLRIVMQSTARARHGFDFLTAVGDRWHVSRRLNLDDVAGLVQRIRPGDPAAVPPPKKGRRKKAI